MPLEGQYFCAKACLCIVRSARSSDAIPRKYSGLNKENGMGKEWGRGGGVSGRQKDRGAHRSARR
eukprot:scaffold7549_cov111-Isochrysis_galbana.AAC.12